MNHKQKRQRDRAKRALRHAQREHRRRIAEEQYLRDHEQLERAKFEAKQDRKLHNQEVTVHHRKPKAHGGSDERRNISLIARVYHEAYHTLFVDKNPADVAQILTEGFIDPDWELIARRKT